MTTLTITATPCINGVMEHAWANTQIFNAYLNIGRHEAITLAVDSAMFRARAHGTDFNDARNTIVLTFGRR